MPVFDARNFETDGEGALLSAVLAATKGSRARARLRGRGLAGRNGPFGDVAGPVRSPFEVTKPEPAFQAPLA